MPRHAPPSPAVSEPSGPARRHVVIGATAGAAVASAGLTPFALMSVLAVLAIVAAGLVRRPFGPALGWVIQALTILSGFWVSMMFLVGALFALLYGYCQALGRRVDREQVARALEEQDT